VTTAATAVSRGCPELALLEVSPLTAEIQDHVDGCSFCQLVVEVCAQVSRAAEDCLHYDALLAAREDGTLNPAGKNLLERHLASCEACREIADTMAPQGDAEVGLPAIDGDAYTLGTEVGRGGMGRVIDAEDNRIGRAVVIKELLGSSRTEAARFEREARLTARLQHPGILPIYEIGQWQSDGTPFYAMRKIEGHTLEAAIRGAATLRARLALLPSLIAACETVAFAHSRHVIHRDLKPDNIMLGAFGETIVIDWGLAKDLSDPGDDEPGEPSTGERLTGAGQAMGTAAYMPREQAYGQPVDERADVYALGAILYQLLAGTPPYRGSDARAVLARVRSEPPPPIESAAPGASPALLSIVKRAMEREAKDRYASAKELAAELARFQQGLLVETHAYSRRELIKRFAIRNRAAVTVTAGAAILLAIVGVLSVRNVLRSREEARATARELLLEKGRIEQLAGNHLRALAYLHEASRQGERSPALDLLLGRAVADVASAQTTLDCGGDDRYLEVSKDGSLLAVACHDRARVWRVAGDAKPALLATLEVPGTHGGFDGLAFSPDHALLVTFGEEGIARVWRTASLAQPYRSFTHQQAGARPSSITFATFTADSHRIATTGDDGFAQIWNVVDDRLERSIEGALTGGQFDVSAAVRRLFGTLTPDDKLVTLVFSGSGGKFDIATGERLGTFQHGGAVAGGEASPDGTLAVSCGLDGISKVVELATGKLLYELEGHTDVVWRCVFDPSSRRVLTSSHDGTAKVWELGRDDRGEPRAHLAATVSHGDLIWIGRFSPDGSRFVTISPGKNMKVWDSASGALLATYGSRGKDARFLPDNRLAALRGDGRIQVWARASSRLAAFRSRGDAAVIGATLDGTTVATLDTAVALWRAASGDRLAHPPIAPPLAFAEDRIAGAFVTPDAGDPASSKVGIVVLDTTGAEVARLTDDALLAPSTLALAGNRLAITWPNRAEIWDLASARRVLTIPDVNHLLLSADGARAVAWRESDPSALDFRLPTQPQLWDVDHLARLGTLPAIDARPIGFALEGRRLVVHELVDELARTSWPFAATVSIWDVDRGTRVLLQPKVEIAPTLDPTGSWLATIGTDREVSVWAVADGTRRSAFTGEPYQRVQPDAAGSLLVAIGDYGRAVMILSGADGRVLAQHQLDHDRARVNPSHFGAPFSIAWWTRDARAIASLSRGFAVWAGIEPRDPGELAQIVKKYVPWRIDNGRLEVIRDGRITGVVTRHGEPVPGAAIEVLMRRPADVSDKPVNWASMRAQLEKRQAIADGAGAFTVGNLVPGEYEYLVTANGDLASAKEAQVGPDEDPIAIELP